MCVCAFFKKTAKTLAFFIRKKDGDWEKREYIKVKKPKKTGSLDSDFSLRHTFLCPIDVPALPGNY